MPRIAAALLLAFWSRDDDHVLHWMVKSLADVVFEMYPRGSALPLTWRSLELLKRKNQIGELLASPRPTSVLCLLTGRRAQETNPKKPGQGLFHVGLPACIEMLPDS